MSQNILKCLFPPRIVCNTSQTKRPNKNTPKRQRIIQHVFLSKYRLLKTRDTFFLWKRGEIPRNKLLSTDLPEIRFKVKNNHRVFQSASFDREFHETLFAAYIFPEVPKIPNTLFEGRDSVLENYESHTFLCYLESPETYFKVKCGSEYLKMRISN